MCGHRRTRKHRYLCLQIQPADLVFTPHGYLPGAHCACASSARPPRKWEAVLLTDQRLQPGSREGASRRASS